MSFCCQIKSECFEIMKIGIPKKILIIKEVSFQCNSKIAKSKYVFQYFGWISTSYMFFFNKILSYWKDEGVKAGEVKKFFEEYCVATKLDLRQTQS